MTENYVKESLTTVCELDRQKRKQTVVRDLIFYQNLSELEAVEIWEKGIELGLLKHYNHWEQDERFKTYSFEI